MNRLNFHKKHIFNRFKKLLIAIMGIILLIGAYMINNYVAFMMTAFLCVLIIIVMAKRLRARKKHMSDFIKPVDIQEKVKSTKSKYNGQRFIQSVKMLIAMFGTLLSLGVFISTFNIPCNFFTLMIVTAFSTFVFAMMLYEDSVNSKIRAVILLITLSLFTLFIYNNRILISNSIIYIANDVIVYINHYLRTDIEKIAIYEGDIRSANTIFLSCMAIMYTSLLLPATWLRLRTTVHLIVTAPTLALCFILGQIPKGRYLLGFVLYYIAVICLKNNLAKKSKFNRLKSKRILYESNYRKRTAIYVKTSFLTALLTLILCVGFFVLQSPSDFDGSGSMLRMREDVHSTINKLSKIRIWEWEGGDGEPLFEWFGDKSFKDVASGGIGDGLLGNVSEIKYKNESHLKITLPAEKKEVVIYLKAFARSKYDVNQWLTYDETQEKKFSEIKRFYTEEDSFYEDIYRMPYLIYDSYQQSVSETEDIKIENIKANSKYSYTPYFADTPSGFGREYELDVYMRLNNTRIAEYKVLQGLTPYITTRKNPFIDSTVPSGNESAAVPIINIHQLHNLYQRYTDYVYDIYTKTPKGAEKLREHIQKEDFGSGISSSDGYEPYIELVREYLNKQLNYTLKPGALPKDADFIDWSLYDNRKGYCTHYATAATIMFREMNIPARYVEGYIVTPNDYKKNQIESYKKALDGDKIASFKVLDIKDTNAHAWVEIFQDGLGWVPVEVTPGYIDLGQNSPNEPVTMPAETTSVGETTTQKPTTTAESVTSITPGGTGTKIGKGTIIIMASAIGAAFIGFLLVMFFEHRRKDRQKRLSSDDFKSNIMEAEKMIQKLFIMNEISSESTDTNPVYADRISCYYRELDIENIEAMLQYIDKVHYSNNEVTKDESEFIVGLYRNMAGYTYSNSTKQKRFIMKYVQNLV